MTDRLSFFFFFFAAAAALFSCLVRGSKRKSMSSDTGTPISPAAVASPFSTGNPAEERLIAMQNELRRAYTVGVFLSYHTYTLTHCLI